jgi:hypothetical protein
VQVPRLTNVRFAPETVHTDAVVEAKLTGRPELAVALRGIGVLMKPVFISGPKVIVWLPEVTWKLWLTGGAVA